MTASKVKGTSWETACVRYLQERGYKVERRALQGNKDRGDIAGLPLTVVECKATKALDLAQFSKELVAEMANDEAPMGVVFVKRRNHSVQDGYAVMPIWLWVDLWEGWRQCIQRQS